MNLLDYIKGVRKGKEAHRIEKESMRDPFLYEAIDGFDIVDDNHLVHIEQIKDRLKGVRSKNEKRNTTNIRLLATACFIGVLGLSVYFLSGNFASSLDVQERDKFSLIEIYVPTAFYKENIGTIAKNNTNQILAHKNYLNSFLARNESNVSVSDILPEALSQMTDATTIDIYIPQTRESVESRQLGSVPVTQQTAIMPPSADSMLADAVIPVASEIEVYDRILADVVADSVLDSNLASVQGDLYAKVEEEATNLQKQTLARTIPAKSDHFALRLEKKSKESRKEGLVRSNGDSFDKTSSLRDSDELIVAYGAMKTSLPEPIIGWQAYNSYLKTNIQRPADDMCKDTKGTVTLEFSTDEQGSPIAIKVIKGICDSCDKEAIRLLKEGSKWNAKSSTQRLDVIF